MLTPEEVLILKNVLMAYMDSCAETADRFPADAGVIQAREELTLAQTLWNKIQRAYPDSLYDLDKS